MQESPPISVNSPHKEDRRKRYQEGSLATERRKDCSHGPDRHCVHCVRVYRYFATIAGKRKRRKVILGTVQELPTRDDAKRASQHLRNAANPEDPQRDVSVRALVDQYTDEVLRPCLIPVGAIRDEIAPLGYGCARGYRSKLQNYVLPKWETYLVRDFEKSEIRKIAEDWFRSLVRTRKNPKGLARKYVRHIFEAMAQVFKYGFKLGYLKFNPFSEKRIELPRGCSKRSKEPTHLTPRQFVALISELAFMPRVAVACLGWLGSRFSEAFGLRWCDLELTLGRVTFKQGFSEGRITDLKNEPSRTDLPIPPELLELLRKWHSVTPYNKPDDWVFASPYTSGQRPYYPTSLMETHVRPIARKLGLPDFGWHDLRHSLATWAKSAGLHDDDVTKLLRQSTLEMAATYGGVEIKRKKQLQQKVFKYVRRASGTRSSRRKTGAGNRRKSTTLK